MKNDGLGWEDVRKERFYGNGNVLGGVKREALNRLGWRRSICSYVGQVAWCCGGLAVGVVVVNYY